MLGNIFILGDSYSTFSGYIPEGYAPYYDEDGPWYLKVNPEMKMNTNDVSNGSCWFINNANKCFGFKIS